MTSDSATFLRRNGKRQSCERCRKMKIKCDHSLPKCGRCLKKNLACFYDPAPMTKKFRSARIHTDSVQPRTTCVKKAATPTFFESHQSDPNSGRWLPSGQAVVIDTPPVKSSGFLGPISYRALMGETQTHLNRLSEPSPVGDSMTTHTIESKRLELGLQIVDFLRMHAVLVRTLVRRLYYSGRMPIMAEALMLPALERLWDIIDDGYNASDESSRLQTVIHIFRNSYQPIPTTKSTKVDEICQLISGENVRWETIGNVLTTASLCLLHIHDRDLDFVDPGKGNKQDLLAAFHNIIDSLSTLTNASPVLNELVVSLKFNQILLLVQRFGDSSQYLYSSFVELTSCIYAAGIHQDSPFSGEYPGFMHQWRRRCFALVYSMDKTIATVLGRPPQMNRHYCILEPPLDIDDDVTGPEIEEQLHMLDQNGWNTEGKRRSATFVRLRFLLATVREEILELHLGVNKADVSRKAQIVMQKLQSVWQACPSNMKYFPNMWRGPLACQYILPILWFYLDYQYSKFLIYRLTAHDSSQGSSERLLSVAKDILSAILVINEERECARGIRSDFTSIFLHFGLPSAEVLIMELLNRPPLATSMTEIHLPRAEIIRELTLYVSCLGWVARPGSGNFEFCKEVKEKLTRILDQIIDPQPSTPYSGENGVARDNVRGTNQEFMDPVNGWNHLFNWDAGMHWDSGLDLLCGPVL